MSAPLAITVVGGGIAGLVAAISCAEAGFPVRLHEARRRLGGRARSTDGEWVANFGPHALCSARTNWSWLRERGLLPRTAWISPPGSRFHHRGRVNRIPPSARVRSLFVPPAVHRVVGGWSALVDLLARRARELSVEIECGRALDYPGTTWRDRPGIEQGDGVFLAGDMVAADGLLSEVSFSSALEASRRAVSLTCASTT